MNLVTTRSAVSFLLLGFSGILSSATSAITVSSAPYGVMAADAPVGKTGLAFPLIVEELFAGVVSSSTGNVVTFSNAGAIGDRLLADEKYYLEIVSGALEGERFDIDVGATKAANNNTVSVDLSAGSFSTSNSLAVNALASARAVVRPHVTLAKLGAMFSPSLVGNNSFGQADTVSLMSTRGMVFYYLRSDNVTWREPGKAADVRNQVIPPDVSVLVQLRSGAKKWIHAGAVRTNAFRKNLSNGAQGFATGFPIDMSPVQIGAFTDLNLPASVRWVGNADLSQADSIKIFDTALNDFRSYTLAADGSTWVLSPDTSNQSDVPILKVPSMIVVTRNNPDSGYVIAPPFSP